MNIKIKSNSQTIKKLSYKDLFVEKGVYYTYRKSISSVPVYFINIGESEVLQIEEDVINKRTINSNPNGWDSMDFFKSIVPVEVIFSN